MIDDIYNSKILHYAAHISHTGRLSAPDASAYKHSRLCGSAITVDLNMADSVVTAFAQDVHACALGQASASIMAQHIIGAHSQELRALHQTMQAMLTENGASPQGKFADFSCLQPVKDYKARHASTMLVFEAIADCIGQIENRG
ncbi:MAG: Nitrogen-fixing NifU domain-containing protein [Candidatus Tokpelaia hoelldobleri]|uniref:Nitrogen-fixing NifU domain-containing protein n=1 Tax=Candidatus Tokpelaia hoelldobleri TaxID=1902579 RepID=A0A1U9JUR8_9HYPH|nr:MAG: Nitrogen-fixing NifU domain-containing protein [Candidatus Tokpelaia hoelldoblerii]